MAVQIGNARISEHGTVNGSAGDQTGAEVMTQPWSTGGKWEYVIRPKDSAVAKKIATAMVAACNNPNIGYSQADRTSLYNLAAQNGFQLGKVGKCNTDCSALVSVCVNAAGIKVSPNMYTGNELSVLKNTGAFNIYSAADYTKREDKLMTGDILLRQGHTAIVTSGAIQLPNDDENSTKTERRGITMNCTYQIEGDPVIYWFDGQKIHPLPHADCLRLLRSIYKDNNGHDMPHYKWTEKAPWWKRLKQAIK